MSLLETFILSIHFINEWQQYCKVKNQIANKKVERYMRCNATAVIRERHIFIQGKREIHLFSSVSYLNAL